MKRFDSFNWTMTPHYPYTPFRVQNMETDVKNQSILPPIPCRVPGSIYEALEKAGVIENPYFEMRIAYNELTREHTLEITDFADKNEVEEQKDLWDSQIENLRRQSGM